MRDPCGLRGDRGGGDGVEECAEYAGLEWECLGSRRGEIDAKDGCKFG